ncbi:hypothetical protein [Thermosulfurimonas dismutans]|uniref:Uncharacterized protein n=1 Tax=Thermosulfurimonas dismutans TaxID=999894 RepID=A0A179D4M4_9BACT|nr:hypothetical protein [Thermosulfurimonas dismutans]OAQ21017.1 hypothetical protein TDIS_0943 [Thermosulfurimonas dismutans]
MPSYTHEFAIRCVALKEKSDQNVVEVKLEMVVRDTEDLSFIMDLVRLKQLPLVTVSFHSPQQRLPLEGKVESRPAN